MNSTDPQHHKNNREMIDDISSVMNELVSDVKELSSEAKELKEMLQDLMKKSELKTIPEATNGKETTSNWFWS